MSDLDRTADDLPDGTGYAELAAEFIADVERIAALRLPVLPAEPAGAAAMRTAGYPVLARCTGVAGASALVCVADQDEDLGQGVAAAELAAALGVPVEALGPGAEFLAVLRETPHEGRVLSGFRPVPAGA
jgi:hypothetical protein